MYGEKVKGKDHPRRRHEGPKGEQIFSSFLSLTSELDRDVVNDTPRPLYPWDRPGTHCIGGWVSLRASLDGCGKSRPPHSSEFDRRTVQLIASRCAD
jgi:hypothetical protein